MSAHVPDVVAAEARLRDAGLWHYVERVVEEHGGLPKELVLGGGRNAQVLAARVDLYVLLAHTEGLGFKPIGRLLGRDHQTILSAVRKYERRIAHAEGVAA